MLKKRAPRRFLSLRTLRFALVISVLVSLLAKGDDLRKYFLIDYLFTLVYFGLLVPRNWDEVYKVEVFVHLFLPLHLGGQTISTERTRWRRIILNNEAGFDGFAKANVVSDQQIDPRHREYADNWVELVFVYLNAAAEGGLQGFVVGLGDGPHRTRQERVVRCSSLSPGNQSIEITTKVCKEDLQGIGRANLGIRLCSSKMEQYR
jgi:hypothetical protein